MMEYHDDTFYEITGTRLNHVSQLKLFNVLKDIRENETLMNIFKTYRLNDDLKEKLYYDLYEIDNDDWWDNISHKQYGTPYLWWTICLLNDVINPFEFIYGSPGKIVKLLRQEYMYQMLKEIRSISGNR